MKMVIVLCIAAVLGLSPSRIHADLVLSVSEVSGYDNLSLSTSQSDLLAGTVTETRTPGGYSVTLETLNGSTTGLLRGANMNNSDTVSFSMAYDGLSVVLSGGSGIVTDSDAATSASGIVKSITLSYTGDSTLAADTYRDTLAFTIAVK